MDKHFDRRRSGSVGFRLASPSPAVSVDVDLTDRGGRWLAVADRGGEESIGLGATARDALGAALAPLGARAARALLADPTLFGVSCAVRELTAAR